MTEAQAWRKLAKWCGTGNPERRAFLCDRLSGRFDGSDSYGPDTADPLPKGLPRTKMYDRIANHNPSGIECLIVEDDKGPFRNASTDNHPRVIFCLLMAIECELEGFPD